MQFGGDTLSLVFLRKDQLSSKGILNCALLFQSRFESVQPHEYQCGDADAQQNPKQTGLPKEWNHRKSQAGAGLLPEPIVVGRTNPERMRSSLQFVKIGDPAVSGFSPVESFPIQVYLKSHLLR